MIVLLVFKLLWCCLIIRCCVCHEQHIGAEPHLSDYKCIWCWRNVHESCLNSVSTPAIVDECDFGQHRNLVLKPNYIESSLNGNATNINISEVPLSDIHINNEGLVDAVWTPLIVFANPKSGSQDADDLLKMFKTLLNPIQVVEMTESEIRCALKWLESYSDRIRFKILICGGDGINEKF